MATLLDRRRDSPRGSRPTSLNGVPAAGMPVTAGVLAAVQAAAASLSVVMVLVVLAWATASFSSAPWDQAARLGVGTWLLAHHAGIVIPGGHVGLVPLGLLAVPLICCWLAGVRLARNLDPNAADLRAGVGRARAVLPPTRALVCLVATYSAIVTIASLLATSGSVRPLAAQALVGAVIISAAGSLCGAAAWAEGGLVPGVRRVLRWFRPPRWLAAIGPALFITTVVQLAGGVVLFVVALVLGWDRVLLLNHALSPGLAGGLILLIAQLMTVPNLAIWAVSVSAGPGFALGAGTAVQAGHTTLGAVPALPILGALPPPGPHPVWAWGLLALPAVSGLLMGTILARRDPSNRWLSTLLDVARAALLIGIIWGTLGWLSGGPAGPGRLGLVGPSAWQLGLTMMAGVGLAALLAAAVVLAVRHFAADRLGDRNDNTDPDNPDNTDPDHADPDDADDANLDDADDAGLDDAVTPAAD